MSSIDKRPNGRFRARYREFPGGPQRTKTFQRKSQAERWLTEVNHRLLSGSYLPPEAGRTTLREWSETHLARQPWRASTKATASASIDHALAVLGDRPISSIRRGDIQAMLAGIDRAPGTVKLVRQHLGSLFQAAVDDDLLTRNPVAGTKVTGSAPGEVVPPTLEAVRAIHEAAEVWFRPAVVLGAGLGLRQAEASGLTVDRVDWLKGRTVRIDRQWSTKVKPYDFAPPKSEASIRVIPAAQVILDELSTHVSDRAGFVLQLDGQPVDHNRFGAAWRKAVEKAGVQPVRFHDLRHHFASSLISAGCSVKAVQRALGHASASTTLDTYGHMWPGDEDRIREAVQAAFSSPEDSLRTGEAAGT